MKWKNIGPGLVLAAAGVGAGDIIANGTAGSSYGLLLIWAIIIGAFIKYILNEGMARYQLGTKKTFIEGINNKSRYFNLYFLVYLVIWCFVVGGALLSSAGVATSAVFPGVSTITLGILNGVIILAILFFGNYMVFEKIMKFFAFIMFAAFFYSAIMLFPNFLEFLKGFIPMLPQGTWSSLFDTLAVIGGVGATVTIMCYSYWIKEHGWDNKSHKKLMRWDLGVGYIITAIFGVSVMVVAAVVLHPTGQILKGSDGIFMLAQSLTSVLGPVGYWIFLLGFYSAVISSLFSFYQSIPYLFADAYSIYVGKRFKSAKLIRKSWLYRGFMLYNVFPPMILLWLKKPIALVKSYTVLGAFFMPFLALMLLILNNDKKLGSMVNNWYTNVALIMIFAMFATISIYSFI